MKYRDEALLAQDFELTFATFPVYCALGTCQTIIRKGAPVRKFDGATYVHLTCPDLPLRTFAAHKYGEVQRVR